MKDGETYYAQESFSKHGNLIALAKYANSSTRMSARLRDAIHDIQQDKSLSKTEKRIKTKYHVEWIQSEFGERFSASHPRQLKQTEIISISIKHSQSDYSCLATCASRIFLS